MNICRVSAIFLVFNPVQPSLLLLMYTIIGISVVVADQAGSLSALYDDHKLQTPVITGVSLEGLGPGPAWELIVGLSGMASRGSREHDHRRICE